MLKLGGNFAGRLGFQREDPDHFAKMIHNDQTIFVGCGGISPHKIWHDSNISHPEFAQSVTIDWRCFSWDEKSSVSGVVGDLFTVNISNM